MKIATGIFAGLSEMDITDDRCPEHLHLIRETFREGSSAETVGHRGLLELSKHMI